MAIVYSSLNHHLRVPLAAEVHSRPFLLLEAPESLTHLAVCSNGAESAKGVVSQHALLASLCGHFGVMPPVPEAKYFFHDFGFFRLKWECHTEFATYTFARRRDQRDDLQTAFDRVPLYQIPQEWLLGLQGRVMVAAHVVLEQDEAKEEKVFAGELRKVFEGRNLVGSNVLQGAEIWTDFLIQADGFSRFVIRDVGLREQQAGRLVQRVLEIETYRMMALLGLPHAQRATPILNSIEGELGTLTATMVEAELPAEDTPDDLSSHTDSEQALLAMITGLAARIEKLSLENNYRFSASQAYFRLVHARIDELRERRIDGFPTIWEFMDRRLTPAMNTCEAVARRQESLAERIAHGNDLLRTRVGIVQERQNRRILQSMNARAAQQLRLQQAVEGLSVAAISYYVIGLASYAGKAAKAIGWSINPDVAAGVLVPVVAACVWFGLRRMHKSMHPG